MSMLRHIMSAPFVFATGLAALVHSTWALGTLMSGTQPPAGLTIEFIGWLLPALLIAFALDVGQIATSADIRQYGMTRARGTTFIVFAGATYYLQWLYMSHHMPALPLADGIRESWGAFATLMRDAAVWIVPLLLPLSTLLYTFSDDRHTHERAQHHEPRHVASMTPAPDVLVMPLADDSPALPFDDDIPRLNEGLTVELVDPLPHDDYMALSGVISVTDVTQLIADPKTDPKEEARAVTPRRRKSNGLIENEKNKGHETENA